MTHLRVAAIVLILLFPALLQGGEPPEIEAGSFVPESGWNRSGAALQLASFAHPAASLHELTWEWGVGSTRHQWGLTLPLVASGAAGVGDASLSYRYQIAGSEDAGWGVAPRLSLILPTRTEPLGGTVSGIQAAVPFSVQAGTRLTLHAVLSATHYRGAAGIEAGIAPAATLQLSPRLGLSVDSIYVRCKEAASLVVRPSLQYAIEVADGTRLVPGIAFAAGDAERRLVFTFSVERPIGR